MKELLQKLKQQAIRSGLATEMHAVPAAKKDHIDLKIILKPLPVKEIKPRELKPGEKLEEAPHPIEQAETLLKEVGLNFVSIRYFDAAKSPAVIVESVSAPKPVTSPQHPVSSKPASSNQKPASSNQ